MINTDLLGTRDVSKKSENSSEPRTEQDGMNEYVETAGEVHSVRGPRTEHDNGRGPRTEQAGEVKDNEVGKHKHEDISGQDEKNKSIEGK